MTSCIFLDIDGVILPGNFLYGKNNSLVIITEDEFNNLCPEAVARLNQITDATGAEIVVSSTRRMEFDNILDLRAWLKSQGITGVIRDRTPFLNSQRGKEIQDFLNSHKDHYEKFIIIDDDDDMLHLSNHLILTTFNEGLQDEHVREAIKRLS